MLNRDESEWFVGTPFADGKACLELGKRTDPLETFEDLPEPDFFLYAETPSHLSVQEARVRNNLIFEFAVDPPEAAQDNRIRMGTLATLLSLIQTIVKHAYGSALREISSITRQAVDRSDAHLMDVVVPAAAGSFRMVMEAAQGPDLTGRSELARALEKMDMLYESVSDPRAAVDVVKIHRGHLAGAYLRLLRFLVQSKTGFHYEWAEPDFVQPRSRGILEAQARPLVELLSGVRWSFSFSKSKPAGSGQTFYLSQPRTSWS